MTSRLIGIDIARFVAFCGMVLVNFRLVMGVMPDGSLADQFTTLLEGKAAATFVILAGLGFALSAKAQNHQTHVMTTLRRSTFLLALGLLNMMIFDADIIHYYAFYFLFGAFFLRAGQTGLLAGILGLNLLFLLLLLIVDYEQGWNFETLTYTDLWTPAGFVRHLFFNGWHPVVPWLSFFLFGIWLARTNLSGHRTQLLMLGSGTILMLIAAMTADILRPLLGALDPELADLATTSPMPPTFLYITTGIGAGLVTLSLCLLATRTVTAPGRLLGAITASGRQTLTLYIAHILIGMGTLEALGLIGGQSMDHALLASLTFCVSALLFSHFWWRRWSRGPLEALMRRLAG